MHQEITKMSEEKEGRTPNLAHGASTEQEEKQMNQEPRANLRGHAGPADRHGDMKSNLRSSSHVLRNIRQNGSAPSDIPSSFRLNTPAVLTDRWQKRIDEMNSAANESLPQIAQACQCSHLSQLASAVQRRVAPLLLHGSAAKKTLDHARSCDTPPQRTPCEGGRWEGAFETRPVRAPWYWRCHAARRSRYTCRNPPSTLR